MFQCVYCDQTTESYKDIVHHQIEAHAFDELKFKRVDGEHRKLLSYKLTPDMCREQGRVISVDEQTNTIHVSRRNINSNESPLKKICKVDGPVSNTEDVNLSEEINIDVDTDCDLQELTELLPSVVKSLKDCGKYEDYISFNQLISKGKFPLDNIAFLLFLDVVRWYSLDKSTTCMRYSEPCKLFWKTGFKLFRGRFLRFMGGPKNKGHVNEAEDIRGNYSADDSSVNFVVPDRKILRDESKILPADKPGIITEIIDDISRNEPEQILTYKICVDGKKINPSSKGEVDLWGYEGEPTLEAKRQRVFKEIEFFNIHTKRIETQIEKGHYVTSDLTNTEKNNVIDSCKSSVTMLSYRIKDLRMLKVNKMTALQKLQDQVQGDWRSSSFSIVISSLRTSIYQIENCIEDMLNINEKLCRYAAITSGNMPLANPTTDVIDLQHQENYVCIGNTVDMNNTTKSELIKQKSESWHKIRDNTLVTGSAINKAIGLDGLKKQKYYLDTKTGRQESEPVSAELQEKFDYGNENELNAIATLVSTFIPAFEPTTLVFEEGCYILEDSGNQYLVVSPDGSIRRQTDEQPLAALEIKCPIPGKLYTTPIQYALPHYYVPQVLSEMKCLKVEKLYFVSYGKESTAVHMVEFDEQLWDDICVEVKNLNPDKSPKRLSPKVTVIKSNIDKFCRSRVQLVAEVKSKIAKACQHASDETGRIYHENINTFQDEVVLTEVQRVFIRGSDAVKTSDSLCSHKASEVLVFLLADLDRIHKPEIPNAYPIAYALKGYSMKASVMRNMIEDVFQELFLKGLYTPVVSYDGQWSVLAYRAKDGKALTLLELQKQVYNEVKNMKKGDLTKFIFETGVVKANEDLATEIDYSYCAERKAVEIAHNRGIKLFQPSSNIHQIIVSSKRKEAKGTKGDSILEQHDNYDITSVVPTEALDNLNDEELKVLQNVNSKSLSEQQSTGRQNTIALGDTIFMTTVLDSQDSQLDKQEEFCEDITEHIEQMDLGEDLVHVNDGKEQLSRQVILDNYDIECMLVSLQSNDKANIVWKSKHVDEFKLILLATEKAKKELSKFEMTLCLETVSDKMKKANIRYSRHWNKSKLANLLHTAITQISVEQSMPIKTRCRRNPDKLATLCKKKINGLPKSVLNAVVAEHKIVDSIDQWREESPFTPVTEVGNQPIKWFSHPEYNSRTMSYMFSLLDVHHLITNCRVKICKDGLPERNISKQAWIDVAKANTTKLKLPHVIDLIDKQSDSIARETFSEDVENAMRKQYPKEANFCKMIREFYDGEDNPGISAEERCNRRMTLRSWLLEDVNFCQFPPYGSHIRGIPNVMFQGFITNIERRIQLFPFVKSGTYNVRSLGSLEAENLFGQFQDLDPKGSGVIRAEEIPSALENACQLLRIRLMPGRPFHMSLSKAKVYPICELMTESGMDYKGCDQFLYPSLVSKISPR